MSRHPIEDQVLLKCVKNSLFAEQSELQIALRSQGIDMPQATLSRRLKRLNIAKVNGIYKVVHQKAATPITQITKILPNLIIINTLPGHANSIAYIVDEEFVAEQIFGIAGTIAGDDTIFVAVDGSYLGDAYAGLKKFFFLKIKNAASSVAKAFIFLVALHEVNTRGRGGIGRHTRLRIWRRKSWGFKSLRPHQ